MVFTGSVASCKEAAAVLAQSGMAPLAVHKEVSRLTELREGSVPLMRMRLGNAFRGECVTSPTIPHISHCHALTPFADSWFRSFDRVRAPACGMGCSGEPPSNRTASTLPDSPHSPHPPR